MRIDSITLNSFGKLKDYTVSFADGFNILYGENEQGKSTIMAFLRMMFYGSSTRDKDLQKNIRRRYTPWDGSKMSGSMDFTHKGNRYRLEKTFGTSPKSDIVKLWNQSTNEPELLTEQKEIGRRFFGMGEDAFEKSVFIGQVASVIGMERDKDNEIIQKLQNLASSGDETQSFHLVGARLQTAIEKIRSRGGRIGLLDRLVQERSRLESDRTEAIAAEAEKEALMLAYRNLLSKKDREDALLSETSDAFEQIRQYRKYKDHQKILTKSKETAELEAQLEQTGEMLTIGEFLVDSAFIEEKKRRLHDLEGLWSLLQNKMEDLTQKERTVAETFHEEDGEIRKDLYEPVEKLYDRISAGKETLQSEQFIVRQEEFALKEAIRYEAELQEQLDRISDCQNRIAELDQQRSLPLGTAQEAAAQRKVRFPIAGILTGLVSLILFLTAGYLTHPLFYVGSVFSAALVATIWIRYSVRKANTRRAALLNEEKQNVRNSQIDSDILFYRNRLEDSERRLKALRMERQDSRTADLRGSDEIRQSLQAAQVRFEKIRDDQLDGQTKMAEAFAFFHVSSFEELRRNYFETQNRMSRKREAILELQADREQLDSRRLELEQGLRTFLGNFRGTKIPADPEFERAMEWTDKPPCETAAAYDQPAAAEFMAFSGNALAAAKDLLEKLTRLLYDMEGRTLVLEGKKKDLTDMLNGRTVTVIRREAESMRNSYEKGEFCMPADEPSDEESVSMEKKLEAMRANVNSIEIELAQLKSEMTQAFLDKPELSRIEESLAANEKQQAEYQKRHLALSMAKEAMEQAFLEMQQTFGPIVNRKTADIFSRITSGKYQELLVSKDLNISFRDPSMKTTQEWQYLSGGTIDQVYFSLRLAIAEFLADQSGGLPLFIDDAFLQYDDERTKQSLLFLEDYCSRKQAQILFFTCHKSLTDLRGAAANLIGMSSQ